MTYTTFEITQTQAEKLESEATAQGGYGTSSFDAPDTMRAGLYWQVDDNWHGPFETRRDMQIDYAIKYGTPSNDRRFENENWGRPV